MITDEMPDRFPAAVRAQAPSTIATTNTHTNVVHAVKRDFFGREILNHASVHASASGSSNSCGGGKSSGGGGSGGGDGKPKVWVTFHEGFSNAVRKPIGMRELMDGFSL